MTKASDRSDANVLADGPRWLDAAERATWLGLASIMIKLPAALDTQLQRDAGLSFFEYMVLAVLSEKATRTMRMSDLASLTNASLSRLSHVAKRLEAKGFLRREPCPDDGRYTNAILTGAGYDKVAAAASRHVATVRALVIDAVSNDQLSQLRAITGLLLNQVDPDSPCPGSS